MIGPPFADEADAQSERKYVLDTLLTKQQKVLGFPKIEGAVKRLWDGKRQEEEVVADLTGNTNRRYVCRCVQ